MINILGISTSCSHEGACLLQDGRMLCAVLEKGFTPSNRKSSFPIRSLVHCLDEGKLNITDLDLIACCDKPLVRGKRILSTAFARAPLGWQLFSKEMRQLISQQLWVAKTIFRTSGFKGRILFSGRHESLAATAFFSSPFSEAAFLTMDSECERAAAAYGVGAFNTLSFLGEQYYPHSLELFFSAFTRYLGLDTCDTGEFAKSASQGKAKYQKMIRSNLIDLKVDGSFALNMKFFDFRPDLVVNSNMLSELLDSPTKPLEQTDRVVKDLACSVLKVIEEVMSRTLCHLQRETGQKKICLIGEGILHCVDKKRIMKGTGFDELHVQSVNGGAIGAALFAWHEYLGRSQAVEMQEQNVFSIIR